MLYCGINENKWVETALNYLPDDIYCQIEGKIAVTVLKSDACRLAQKILTHEEVIVLSPWLFSFIPPGSTELDKECRYLIFCVLHEVAHAVSKHDPPDELTATENKAQENEADRYAFKWYNDYVLQHSDTGLAPIVIEEIRDQQENYQKKLKAILVSVRKL